MGRQRTDTPTVVVDSRRAYGATPFEEADRPGGDWIGDLRYGVTP